MKIKKSTVEKLTITDIPNLDPVSVFVEDFGPKYGKVTITCFDECWSYDWSGLPEREKMAQFFVRCDVHYLGNKLRGSVKESIEDTDALESALKKGVIRQRRALDIDASLARKLWESAECIGDELDKSNICYDIFGDEWWYQIPTKVNPQYEYLCRIINVVKDALKKLHGETA